MPHVFAVDVAASPTISAGLLCAAGSAGSIAVLELLRAAGANVNAAQPNGLTGLKAAAMDGRVEFVRKILEAGAHPLDSTDPSTMMLAVAGGRAAVVSVLIGAGVDPEQTTSNGEMTMLMLAADQGHIETARVLLGVGHVDVNATGARGFTALTCAIVGGSLAAVRLLIEAGADVNVVHENGERLLTTAARCGRDEATQVLLEAGAVASAGENGGLTPMFWATRYGHPRIVGLLANAGGGVNVACDDGRTPLMAATDAETIARLLDLGAEIDAVDSGGRTALAWATMAGQMVALRALMEAGASLDAPDEQGKTALAHAVDLGQREAAYLLIRSGAKVDFQPPAEFAMQAVDDGAVDVVSLLVGEGKPVGLEDTAWTGSVFLAAGSAGQTAVMGALLAAGVEIDVTTADGMTALMGASLSGQVDFVRAALDHGADPNIVSQDGFSALLLAVAKDHGDIEELLLDAGADPSILAEPGDGGDALAGAEGGTSLPTIAVLTAEAIPIATAEEAAPIAAVTSARPTPSLSVARRAVGDLNRGRSSSLVKEQRANVSGFIFKLGGVKNDLWQRRYALFFFVLLCLLLRCLLCLASGCRVSLVVNWLDCWRKKFGFGVFPTFIFVVC